MKLLKITNTKGDVNHYPYNKVNLDFHKTWKSNLSQHKQAIYKVEEIELTDEEAAELGFAEAIAKLSPAKTRNTNKENTNVIELLMQQNKMLMDRLEKLESKEEVKPKKEKANG